VIELIDITGSGLTGYPVTGYPMTNFVHSNHENSMNDELAKNNHEINDGRVH
jgi:hypothetical protein